MASFLLCTVGSTGDVVPFLAAAKALEARGHQVRLATHGFHTELCARAGLSILPIGPDWTIEDLNGRLDVFEKVRNPATQYARVAEELFMGDVERSFARVREASAEVDAVLVHRSDYVSQEAAIAAGKPWATLSLQPYLIRTRLAPLHTRSRGPKYVEPAGPPTGWRKFWTELTWEAGSSMFKGFHARVAQRLAQIGAAPRPMQIGGISSPHLDLLAASPALTPPRADWPARTHMIGAIRPLEAGFELPEPLERFLETHPKPVVVSFGSMGGSKGAETTKWLLDALSRLDRPAVVQHGYAGLLREEALPEHILAVGAVPHARLFPRAGCIVHHCGAGTTHAAARSGVPSAPVPHHFDQFYWSGRLWDVGAAPKPQYRYRLSAKGLAKHIESAFAYAEPAAALGAVVAAEDGAPRAAELLEAWLH